MLRSGVYSLWKSYNCTALEAYNAAQCVSGCMALLKKDWASPCSVSPYSTDSLEEERVINNPKVLELADQITQLNLLEVSDLTELLRKRLNIQSLPSVGGFPMGGMHVNAGATQGSPAPSTAANDAPVQERSEFNLKLESFDAASKIKVIKEVRSITDLGLKEAKELVESAPAVLRKSVKKEEAEQIKAKLEAAGAKVSLE